MSDDKPNAPAAAAAPAPVQNPAQQALANLDALVELQVIDAAGRQVREIVPLRSILPDAQAHRSGNNLLEQAKALRAQNTENERLASSWRSLQGQLAADPDGAVAGIQRLANLAKGTSVNAPASRPTLQNSQGAYTAPRDDDGDVDPQTRDLQARLASLESQLATGELQKEIAAVFELYPALGATPELRESTELTLMAAKAHGANVPLERVGARLHTGIASISGTNLTQERDRRQANQAANPHVPVNTGAASMQQEPAVTRQSVRDGSLLATLEAARARFMAPANGGS